MTGTIIVAAVIASALIILFRAAYRAQREDREAELERQSRERVKREYAQIVQKRPNHVVDVSRWFPPRD